MFIVIEGINGCGKSTQVALLGKLYQEQGKDVVLVREPGGTPIGEKIRDLLRLAPEDIHSNAQIALFMASRAQLSHTVVIPAIDAGKCVIADRWQTSTQVYQGYASGAMSYEDLNQLDALFNGGLTPSAVIVLDLPYEEALIRREKMVGDKSDRFEQKERNFQYALWMGYRTIAESFPRHKLVDGLGTPEQVHVKVVQALDEILTNSL